MNYKLIASLVLVVVLLLGFLVYSQSGSSAPASTPTQGDNGGLWLK